MTEPVENSPEDAAKLVAEVRLVLSNLRLQPYCKILGIDEIRVAAQVKAWQKESNSGVVASELAFREISRLLYEACRCPVEKISNGVYEWLWAYLKRVLYRMTHSQRELSEDLAAEAITKISNKLATCKSPYSFLAWCKQIAYREYLMHRRKNKPDETKNQNYDKPDTLPENGDLDEEETGKPGQEIRQVPLDSTEGQMLEAGPDFDPLRKALSREQLQQLMECIKNIKQTRRAANYRRILIETFIKGTRLEDLVDEMGLSLEELRRQRKDALNQLQKDRECIDRLRDLS